MPISNIISQQALAILSNNGGGSNGIISIPFTVIIQPNLECEYPNFLPGDSTFSIKNNYFNSLYVIAIDDFTGTIYPNEILGYTHVNILKKLNSSNLYLVNGAINVDLIANGYCKGIGNEFDDWDFILARQIEGSWSCYNYQPCLWNSNFEDIGSFSEGNCFVKEQGVFLECKSNGLNIDNNKYSILKSKTTIKNKLNYSNSGTPKKLDGSNKIYPNPFWSKIEVILTNKIGKIQIDIFEPNGKIVYSSTIHQYNETDKKTLALDLSNLESGLYYCKIMDAVSIQINKLIKQ